MDNGAHVYQVMGLSRSATAFMAYGHSVHHAVASVNRAVRENRDDIVVSYTLIDTLFVYRISRSKTCLRL